MSAVSDNTRIDWWKVAFWIITIPTCAILMCQGIRWGAYAGADVLDWLHNMGAI
jgi:hypothetical protein